MQFWLSSSFSKVFHALSSPTLTTYVLTWSLFQSPTIQHSPSISLSENSNFDNDSEALYNLCFTGHSVDTHGDRTTLSRSTNHHNITTTSSFTHLPHVCHNTTTTSSFTHLSNHHIIYHMSRKVSSKSKTGKAASGNKTTARQIGILCCKSWAPVLSWSCPPSSMSSQEGHALVCLAAILLYLTADLEILKLAGNAAHDNKKQHVVPHHLQLAIQNDEE